MRDKVIDISDILNAISVGEEVDWEFKSAKGGLPGSAWETYSAMANTDGGTIVLGIGVKEEGYVVEGLDDPDRIRKQVWDLLNNRGKVSINLLCEGDVQAKSITNKNILVIHVPRATRRQRPVYIGQNPLLGTFRRNYEGDYRCTEDEVGRMLADRSEEPADGVVLDSFSLKDLDEESLKGYRNRFASRSPDHPWLVEDDKGLLIKLGGWRVDRKSNTKGLTVAGLLMFGKMESIRDPHAVPQYHVDYRERLSEDPSVRWSDRITLDGTWTGNLFQFYLRVIQKLSKDLKIPFQLSEDMFRKDDTVVHEAIREALTNAMIHADYRGQGGIVIDQFPDRIEMSNPGSLLISREQIREGGISECRNKSLQLMFQMIGLGEKVGSGIDKIIKGWKSQNWRPPGIREQFQPDRVKLILPMVSLIPDQSSVKLHQLFGDKWHHLPSGERLALAIADTEGDVTNVRLREVTANHPADLTKMLQGLVRRGFLVSDGKRRWSRYKLPSASIKSNNINEIESGPSRHQVGTKSGLSQDQVKIIQSCSEAKSLLELMNSCGRKNRTKFRNQFLKPLLSMGLIEMTIPDKPKSRLQKYRLTSAGVEAMRKKL